MAPNTTLLILLVLVSAFALQSVLRARKLGRQLSAVRDPVRVEPELALRTRDAFSEDLEIELLRVDRTGRPSCLVVFSLDGGPGDAQLRRRNFARLLHSKLRTVDVGYRTGSDEFAVILPETRARGALVAAARVEQALMEAGAGRLTAGIAEAGPGVDRHTLFRNAYCALLAAGTAAHAAVLAYSLELERGAATDTLPGLADIRPVGGSHRSHR